MAAISRRAQAQYSEQEAARQLGLSLPEFRSLLRRHIVETEDDLSHVSVASFYASDLVVLKILSAAASFAGSPE